MIESVDEGNASVRLRVHRIAPEIAPVLMSSVFLLQQWQGIWGFGKHVNLHTCHWTHPQPNDKKPKLSLLPTACDIKLTDGCDPTRPNESHQNPRWIMQQRQNRLSEKQNASVMYVADEEKVQED